MIPGAPTVPFNRQAKGWMRWFLCVLSMAGLIWSRQTAPAGCYCMMDSMSASASYNKTGFAECQPSTPPKLFLARKTMTSNSGGGAASPSGTSTTWATYDFKTETYDPAIIFPAYKPLNCQGWTLGYSSTDYSGNSGDVNSGEDAVFWQQNFSYIQIIGATPATSFSTNTCNGWWQDSYGDTGDICADPGPVLGILDPYFKDSFPTLDEDVNICTSTMSETHTTDSIHSSSTDGFDGEVGYYNQQDSYDTIVTLSQEFTESMLTGQIKAWLTNWPPTWVGGTGTAYFGYNDDNHFCASGGKMKYHVKVPNSDLGTTYVLHWQEITLVTGSTNTIAVDQQEQIQGTGDPVNPAVGKEHDVDMPTAPSVIYETAPDIIQTFSNSGGGGSGGGGGNGRGPSKPGP